MVKTKKSTKFDELKVFIENLPGAVALLDKDIKYLAYSEQWLAEYNLEGQNLRGKSHYEVFPNIPQRWKEIHQDALKGNFHRGDVDNFIHDGKRVWLHWDVRPWYENDGSIGGIMMMSTTFSEEYRKTLEVELALKNTQVGIWNYYPADNQFHWDDNIYSLYGLKREDFNSDVEAWESCVSEEEREKALSHFLEIVSGDTLNYEATFPIKHGDGEIRYIGTKGIINRDDMGKAVSVTGINFDKTQEVLDKKELENAYEYLDLALEATDLGIWDWWLEDNTVKFDRRWGEMLGIPYEELEMTLETWSSRVHPDDIEKCYRDIKDYLDGKTERYKNTHRMKHANGEWIYIYDQGKISERDENGKPIRFTGTHLNVTRQKRQEIALNEAIAKVESAEKSKTEFFANMSHEIRSPMNGVLGMTELLSDTSLSKEQREMLDTIKASGETLLTVINDILDISKIESNKLVLESVEFNLVKAMKEVYLLHLPQAEKQGISFEFEESLGNDFLYLGDVVRIKQIATNLVSNAIKFTKRGGVKVKLRVDSSCEDSNCINLEVSDTGLGIANSSQKSIFSAFEQADSSITREYGGTGLGLAITNRLVRMMDGKINLHSEEGVGSTFQIFFKLPKSKNNPQEVDCEVFKNTFSDEYPHSILLVEDNKINQKVASSFLKKLGYSCEIAENGAIAISMLKEKGPEYYSLIFMDIQMPVMDGITATTLIKKEYGERSPKIVALSANAFDSDLKKAFDIGMNAYISKPVRLGELKKVLAEMSSEREPKKKVS